VDDYGCEIEGDIQIMLRGDQYMPQAKAYRVVGESMSGIVEHGDIVLVDTQDAFNTHRPCVFRTPNGYIVKMRGLHRGRFALLSAPGSNVPPITDMTDVYPEGSAYAKYKRPYIIHRIS